MSKNRIDRKAEQADESDDSEELSDTISEDSADYASLFEENKNSRPPILCWPRKKEVERETNVQEWVEKEAAKVLDEYFECEHLELNDEDLDATYYTIRKRAKRPKSPTNGRRPPPTDAVDGWRVVRGAYEQAIPRQTVHDRRRGRFFTIMAGTNISHAIMLSFVMMRYGGWYFLIPFLLSTFLIAFPVNFIQYFLSQFSTMPPAVLLPRLAPINFSLGLFVFLVQYITSSTVRFDHRFVSMGFELFYSLVADRPPFRGASNVPGHLNGFVNVCPPGEVFREGTCYNPDTHHHFGQSYRQNLLENFRNFLQDDPTISAFATADTPPDRVFNPIYQDAHYISAATVYAIALFFVALIGIKTFFTRTQHVVFFGAIFSCTVVGVYMVGEWDQQATIFVRVIGADASKLLEIKTWAIAAIQSFIIFSTTDGSFYAAGAVNRFQNDLLRDMRRTVIGSVAACLMFGWVFGMATVVGAGIHFAAIEKRTMTVVEYRNLLFNDENVYHFLYVFFFQSAAFKLWLIAFMLIFTAWQFSSLMLMAEATVGSFYRVFRSTVRLPQFVIRYKVLSFHFVALLSLHFFLDKSPQVPFLVAPYTVFLQILAFNTIRYRRLFAILISVTKMRRLKVYNKRKTMEIYLQYVLPLFSMLPVLYDMYANGVLVARFALFPVLFCSMATVFRLGLRKRILSAFRPTRAFRPAFNQDFAEYKKQRRALEGKFPHKTRTEVKRLAKRIWKAAG
ncbi:unnamed protein product [Caenorhabditis sp. 36 PRJEB53466]|nr:unnamed protein product [Caenorhabditis sp. 36 PRJEB53466]